MKYKEKSEVILNPVLKELLNYIEAYTNGKELIITDAERSIKQHVDIYKKLDAENKLGGKKWYEVIPWESDHLPAWNKAFLDCVDFAIEGYNGNQLMEMVLIARRNMVIQICLGLGVGSNFIHVSLRKEDSSWSYNY